GSRDVQVVVAAAATAENLEAGAKVQHGRVGPHAGVAAGANGPHLGSDLAQECLAVALGFVQALDDKGIGNAVLYQRHHRTGGQKGRLGHVSLRASPLPFEARTSWWQLSCGAISSQVAEMARDLCDVVLIGAGNNGLVCAAYHAR